MTTGAALFVFAHQDDEATIAPRILFELRRGAEVLCAFLTDGGARTAPGVRDRESLKVLTRLGVAQHNILFVGSETPIPAGTLVDSLDLALERLERATSASAIDTVYCLAWEGGNADHDAAHLVAAAFAQRQKLLEQCWEFPLYHGEGMAGPFFRAASPLSAGGAWERRRLTFRDGLRASLLVWLYRSQWRTWAGLFPEAFLKLAVLRREVMRRVDPSRLRARPHQGSLLYERRFRVSHEHFAAKAKPFVDRHFPES